VKSAYRQITLVKERKRPRMYVMVWTLLSCASAAAYSSLVAVLPKRDPFSWSRLFVIPRSAGLNARNCPVAMSEQTYDELCVLLLGLSRAVSEVAPDEEYCCDVAAEIGGHHQHGSQASASQDYFL
jgi:hypothetical protein